MDPERWHTVDRLFAEALDRPTAERPAFLTGVCTGDAGLRREVERLLAADAEGCGFLESPPDELLRLTLDDQEEGGNLGPYRLLRRIGSGGMGTVYLARRRARICRSATKRWKAWVLARLERRILMATSRS